MASCALCPATDVHEKGLCVVCYAKCLAMPSPTVTEFGQHFATRKVGPVEIVTYDFHFDATKPVALTRMRIYYNGTYVHGEYCHRIATPFL